MISYCQDSNLQKPKEREEELGESGKGIEMQAHRNSNQNSPNQIEIQLA